MYIYIYIYTHTHTHTHRAKVQASGPPAITWQQIYVLDRTAKGIGMTFLTKENNTHCVVQKSVFINKFRFCPTVFVGPDNARKLDRNI